MITAILIAYNNAPFVSAALLSALDQDPPFEKIVVVEDCSTDDTFAILEAECAQQPHVQLIRHEKNKGPGAARNTGLDYVETEYFCFLNGDGLLLPTASRMFADALGDAQVDLWMFAAIAFDQETGESRVVGRVAAGTYAEAEDKKTALGGTTFPWNKLYRTNMVRENGIRFAGGRYEDIPWCVNCVLSARHVAAFRAPVVHYRLRTKSLLQSQSTRHFDAFDQWQRAIDICVTRGGPRAFLEEMRLVQLVRILSEGSIHDDDIDTYLDRLTSTVGPLDELSRRLETRKGIRAMGRLNRILKTR